MSTSTCTAQSDSIQSMQENLLPVELGKGGGGGGGVWAIREGRHGGKKEGRGMRGSQS